MHDDRVIIRETTRSHFGAGLFIGAHARVLSNVGDAHPPRNARTPEISNAEALRPELTVNWCILAFASSKFCGQTHVDTHARVCTILPW